MRWDDIAKIVPMGNFRVLTACIRKENISSANHLFFLVVASISNHDLFLLAYPEK